MQQAYKVLFSKRNRRHFHLYNCSFGYVNTPDTNVYVPYKSGQK